MRRDVPLAFALLVVMFTVTPAYGRVLGDGVWRGPVLLAAVLAIALAASVRALRGGALLGGAVSLTGLALFTYVTALPEVGLLPDASSWASYLELLGQAGVDLREQRAPAPTTPGFLVALTTGTWLVAHTAHELLVRVRTPGAALVPPLVLWAVPLAIPFEGDTTGAVARAVPFLAAAVLILLLGSDRDAPADRAPRVTASGLAVGGSALVAAVVAPMLLPGYDAAALLDLEGSSDPRGYQPIVDISERLQTPQERDVLLVRSDQRSYLRLAGLDSFDGNVWRLGPAGSSSYRPSDESLFPGTSPLPPEEPAGTTTEVTADVEVLDLANIYVPSPYQPTEVTGPLSDQMVWSTDGGFLATWSITDDGFGEERVGVTRGASYRVRAQRPTPSIEDVRDVSYDQATLERWTALPAETGLGPIAEQVYADAGATTVVDRALALQRWFTEDGRFTYDLDVPPLRGSDQLVDFVTTTRVGYCEQFATAMAVMLRETGIPARVAVGFLPGEVTLSADPEAGRELTEYTVRTTDAHAWVEVLFPGAGWVAFEPTPRDDGAQFVPTEDDLIPDEPIAEREARGEVEDAPDPAEDDAEATEPDETEAPEDEPAEDEPGAAVDDEGTAGAGVGSWLLAGLLAALLGVGALVAVGRTRRPPPLTDDPAGHVLGAQRGVLRTAAQLGVGRQPAETLAETVSRWAADERVTAEDADPFVTLAQQAAFAGDAEVDDARRARALGASLEQQLRASATRSDRLVAPVRPTLDELRAAVDDLRGRAGSRSAGRGSR